MGVSSSRPSRSRGSLEWDGAVRFLRGCPGAYLGVLSLCVPSIACSLRHPVYRLRRSHLHTSARLHVRSAVMLCNISKHLSTQVILCRTVYRDSSRQLFQFSKISSLTAKPGYRQQCDGRMCFKPPDQSLCEAVPICNAGYLFTSASTADM